MAGNNRTGIVLQPRDLRLLEALETMRVIDREQAKVVGGFRSTTRANARLLALTKAGFLRRAFLGSNQAVYWLANRELQKLRKRGETSTEPAALFLRHRLEINRLQLVVQYTGISAPRTWFGRWQSFQEPLSRELPLIPDGYFEISSGQDVRSIFVEIDLGTEAVPVFAKKASLYLQLATSGDFSKLFSRTQFRVLVVTTSASRLNNLRAAVAKQTDKIFWFGPLENLTADRFWAAAWLRPNGDQGQSLL
jgi:hypothetical protein